jgi:hypothetical protein
MAINLQVYSNAYNTTKTIAIDFVSDIATITDDSSVDDTTRYFFKMTTSAKDTDELSYTPRVVTKLSDLALNKTKQSSSNVASDYSTIKDMILDYVYDYMNGHSSDQYLSGVSYKAPMKVSS